MQKYLIISVDDIGMCRAINEAGIDAWSRGRVSSLSFMPPAPAFYHGVKLAQKHNVENVGVHLTLLSEFSKHRWKPLLPACSVSSLIDRHGYFHSNLYDLARHARADEAFRELNQQILTVRQTGFGISHLDCHMFALCASYSRRQDLTRVFYRLAKRHRLPVRSPFRNDSLLFENAGVPHLRRVLWRGFDTPLPMKKRYYLRSLSGLSSGVTEMVLHCGAERAELKKITRRWRDRLFDYRFALSKDLKKCLSDHEIQLISWERAEPILRSGKRPVQQSVLTRKRLMNKTRTAKPFK